MPTYRSITTSLRVAANCQEVAEYEPPTPAPYSLSKSTGDNLQPSHPPSTNQSNMHDPFISPPVTLLDIPRSIVSVYTIIHDISEFWLQYSIAPPHPPNALYYFKFFINGTPVASWGCGEEEGWKGSTMWGIFAGDSRRMERRSFCWAKQTDGGEGVMEVRVFRAKGRMRVVPEAGRWDGLVRGGKEIRVTAGGALPRKLPRRFYRFALLDPLDSPFATFRYYCRSLRQLKALGVKSLLLDSSPPTSRSSHSSDSENEEPERKDEQRQRDNCSSNLGTDTSSSGSSGASSGEELLTQFASSGLESANNINKARNTATELPSTSSKANPKKTTESTNISPSASRHRPRPLPLVPISSFSSITSPQLKNPPVSNHDSLTSPAVPAKQSRPSSTTVPPRSALFSPKPHDDSQKPPTVPAKNPSRSPPTLPPRSALFSPKPHPSPLPRSPGRTSKPLPGPPPRSPHPGPKPRSSREQFAAMIREGFPSPESTRWKLDEERYGTSGNESANARPEEEEGRIEEGDRKVGRDSTDNERRRRGGGGGSAEGKVLKQGSLRMGMLKKVVESAVSRKREG